jgi:phage antirepressor YoqD-like protein
MSSREIAELLEKQHSHIKVSAERLAEKSVIGTLAVREFTHNGNTYTEYLLNKRDSLILVAQNSPEFTARIVDRWQELEAQHSAPALNPANFSRLQLIELAMQAEQERLESEKQRQILTLEVQAMAPKVKALEQISASDDTLTMTQAAKLLGIKRDTLTHWLHANGWIYRQNASWVAYDAQIRTGRLVYKEAKYTDENTGQEVHRPYCHLTQKGLAYLAEKGPILKLAA